MSTGWKLKAQLMADSEIALGPGKVDLLEAISRTGSISAAGRDMGLSYRRAWLMVDAMNRLFKGILVETVQGGKGGASLSALGVAVMADYRTLEAELEQAGLAARARLLGRLKP